MNILAETIKSYLITYHYLSAISNADERMQAHSASISVSRY